jgi:hypothetical protein
MKIYLRNLAALFAAGSFLALSALASDQPPTRPIAVNQTDGYGNNKLLAFTYFMNYHCTHEPFDDLNHNGHVAATDPDEFQTPVCAVGVNPMLDPAGKPISETEPLYILVPFFDLGGGQAFTPELGNALRSLFGIVPEAFKIHPGVPVQCPEPGPPLSQLAGAPGTCTMHTKTVDLAPALAKLGVPGIDPNKNLFVPTPNHSHVLNGDSFGPIWWQVITVLVTDPSVWPNVDGTRGLNSVAAIRAAQQHGQALPDLPSNFFLFFDAQQFGHAGH